MYAQAHSFRADTAQMYVPPEDIPVSKGIAGSLVTAAGPYEPDLTPYMSAPADALDSRRYSAVVFLGPGRCGKTVTLIDGWIARNVVHAPGDMLIVQASQDLARYYSKIRIDRMVAASPNVKSRISPRRQDDNTYDKVFRSGMVLSIGWPSGAQLSGRDFRYVAITEYDLAADDIDDEGSLFALASKRTETFLSAGKVVVESSVRREYRDAQWRAPSDSPHMAPPVTGITGLYNSGTRNWYYWRCYECGEWMALKPDIHDMFDLPPLDQLAEELPKVDAVKWASAHAVIPCRSCGTAIKETKKRELNKSGVWVPDGCSVSSDGKIIGDPRKTDIASFQLSSVAAAYASWPKLLEKYAVAIQSYARTGSEVDIKSTVNLDQGRAYLPLAVRKQRHNHELQDRVEDWPEQTVPDGVRFLIAQIDIQAGKHSRFVIQVIGFGKNRERWIIDRYALKSSRRPTGELKNGEHVMHPIDPASYIEDWDRLIEKVLLRRYLLGDGSGRSMPIHKTFCDSGGKAGVTQRAYEFWRRLRDDKERRKLHLKFLLVKGAEREAAKTVEITFPDATKRNDRNSGAAGDVPVLLINVTQIKDIVIADVWRTAPGPGYYHFPGWLPSSFFDELTSETRNEKRWVPTPGKPNETFDLCTYAEAGHISLNAHKMDWTNPTPWAAEWDKNPEINTDQKIQAPAFYRRGVRNSGIQI